VGITVTTGIRIAITIRMEVKVMMQIRRIGITMTTRITVGI
jgi:hypothetical protein